MSGFNDFMDKAGALATKAAEKAKDLATVAAAKTKQVSRVAKLNMDVSSQKDVMKAAYVELGKLYYEAHRDAPDPALAQLCAEIDQAKETIASLEAEIAQIKEEIGESADAADGDFASVVDQTAAEADVIVEIVEEETLHPETPAEPAAPEAPEQPAEPEAPAEPAAPAEPEEEKPAE